MPEGHGVGAGLPLAHLVKVRVRASFRVRAQGRVRLELRLSAGL